MMIQASLQHYIESQILPQYEQFDRAHDRRHAKKVIENSLDLAKQFEVNIDMVYTIAAYHDIGLRVDRAEHHIHSGRILMDDAVLSSYFSREELLCMKEAVEDHRASNSRNPRSIYGAIVAEADRDIGVETIFRRTIQFGLKNYPELTKEAHWQRAIEHISAKYGEGGYLKLTLQSKQNREGLAAIRALLKESDRAKTLFSILFEELVG